MSTKKVYPRSFRGALDVLEKLALGDDDTVFRGHSDSEWRICSTLSRFSAIPHESWDTRVDEMLSHFMTNLRSIGEMPADLNSDRRARLEYGRHHDVPSPLIDFSLSPYVALFFAFNGFRPDRTKPDKKVVVYALDTKALGLGWSQRCASVGKGGAGEELNRFLDQSEPLFAKGYPAGVLKYIRFPASSNKRMQRQMGVFIYDTLNYAHLNLKDFEDLAENVKEPRDATSGEYSPTLPKVFVPCSVAGEAFSRLELMGISATRLYDDRSGAAADVKNAYNYSRKTGYAWDQVLRRSRGPSS
jgi:hypothetical protein